MINNFMNNPFLDMFKDSFESPMNMWSKAFQMMGNNDMNKSFNPINWTEMSNKMTESCPWIKGYNNEYDAKKAFNFGEHVEGMEGFSELSHLALENTQAMLHRQAEIIQKHSAQMYKTMQEIASSSNHADNIETHQDYIHSSFESMVNDFKELAEMYSKASLETFDAASNKMTEHMKGAKAKKHHYSYAAHKAGHNSAHEDKEHEDKKSHSNKKK